LKEYEGILTLTRKIEAWVCEDVVRKSKEFRSLALIVAQNRPEFNAARFFSIDKSTLFSILSVLVTFVIVIIQFKIKL
jgi:hypothetical protein